MTATGTVPQLQPTKSPPESRSRPRLPVPASVSRINWEYALPVFVIHALALLVFVPWFFSWPGVLSFVVGINFFGQLGIPVGYHRLLTHRSFQTPKWVERCLVLTALCSAQESPAQWVAWHRLHHAHSDEHGDPHSPLVTAFWSHFGWLMYYNREAGNFSVYQKYARDILEDPFYMFLTKHRLASAWIYLGHAVLYFLVVLGIGSLWYGFGAAAVQLALSMFVWGVLLRTVWVWHITWAVNSLSHMFGYRNYETADESRNNWLVALITGGEGWHNNHHEDQASASVQHRWWEFDMNYYIIRTMAFAGLASHVIPPRHVRRGLPLDREGQPGSSEA